MIINNRLPLYRTPAGGRSSCCHHHSKRQKPITACPPNRRPRLPPKPFFIPMELELVRTYFAGGTNGQLWYNGKRFCYTIELPWKNNEPRVSCISPGRYQLAKSYDEKFGRHLWLENVPGRQWILIHPANDALLELLGCIAPVSQLTGEGKGLQSRMAFMRLTNLVYGAFARNETAFITIKTSQS